VSASGWQDRARRAGAWWAKADLDRVLAREAGDIPGAGHRAALVDGHGGRALYAIQGGGHSVPHPAMHGWRLLGNSNRDIHAADEIWEFFQSAP
jgi:poly(3-hydroxybutyrate) depolymerase